MINCLILKNASANHFRYKRGYKLFFMYELSNDIIEQAANGDRESFKVLYDTYNDFVYRLALGMLRQQQDAEEITQEVFIQIYKKLKNFRFESSLKTWIYRIVVNLTLNYQKRDIRRYKRLSIFKKESQLEKNYEDLNHFSEDSKSMIARLLAVLSPEQRQCIILRNVENLSYEEISRMLNVNVNTVRSRVMRAREKMMSLKEEILHEIR